jgi:dolichyl-phosphate-mannose-protein mannosyltransferase
LNTAAFLSLYGLPFLLIAGVLARKTETGCGETAPQLNWLYIAGWIVLGVLLRLPLLWDQGFHYDTSTYKAWALSASDPSAPLGMYRDGEFTNHPPLFMYILGIVGTAARLLSIEGTAHFTAAVKIPALLADALTSLLLLRLMRPQMGGFRALGMASLYWLNPALIFVGSLWGQTDALLCLAMVLAWTTWSSGRLNLAACILAAAVALKPQGALYAAIFMVAVPLSVGWRRSLTILGSGLLTYAFLVLPFAWSRSFEWLLSLYFDGSAEKNFITVNAYNLWALLGWNWRLEAGSFLGLRLQTWAALDAAAVILGLSIWLGRSLRQALTDTTVRRAQIAWAFALGTIALFMLAPRMHERYILMVLPALFMLEPVRTRLPLIVIWTVAGLANIAYVYYHYIELSSIAPHDTPFIRISSAANLAAAALTLLYWQLPDWPERIGKYLPSPPKLSHSEPPAREAWSRAHGLAICGFILAAGLIGLHRLGATTYPSNGHQSDGFTVEYHYDVPVDARHALIYTGEKALGDTPAQLRLERYENGQWIAAIPEREFNSFYATYEVRLESPGPSSRYRWTAKAEDWLVLELALFNLADQPLLPTAVVGIDVPHAQAVSLADEHDSWVRGRGYLAGTYFDEIYHVRSGYEFLHRMPLYDHTHPPLGKWPIMLSIDIFGMQPFGWRFAGVVASAITVGVLAWGGWLLTGSLQGLLLGGALGLFEFSRFTIGRYGTIDGYLGLFLLLTVLFLWRAFCLPRRRIDDWRDGWTLSRDLMFAGASLGAAIAVKWSALYGGFGVFLFFTWSAISGLIRDGQERWYRLLPRAAGAVIAFALVPFAVYCLSYIPFLRCMQDSPSLFSTQGWHEIVKSQQYIYSYHANQTDSHPFASESWSWPINLKPLWIFTGEGQPRTAISILGNPLIWWGGLLALIVTTWQCLRRPRATDLLLLCAWAALYLPWALIDRTIFNYHYYPSALILVLLLAYRLSEWARTTRWTALPLVAALSAGLLFIWFYPTISGHPAPDAWFKSLRWLPTWWML